MPAALILRLARTSRWAIVASATRNARAISSVRQAAERAQRQRDLRLGRERRMAAGEDELEPLVGKCVASSIVVLRRLAGPRAGGSSRPACGRGGCGRSRGCARSSPARRPGWRGRRRAASARPRSRTPPARLPRRGRSRRGSRSARRGRGPTASRKICSRIATTPRSGAPRSRRPCARPGSARRARSPRRGRRPRRTGSRRRLLDLDERAVGGQRLAVLHPHGRRRLGRLQLPARA